ncbi:unnamed protein product [Musa acuminata subsp. malaccensis]|uniref:(wild Malaysian banana) hypothetical protein n=1 Tax=Musa acuminata subsp. malaccensis TaxID=214687 RepID=A0A804KPQ0_MUSAM|nr:unnamed protein product [Musa acuminata subsp. malaccensis]
MCCPSKTCCCFLLVLVILLIGFVFGFGVFAHGFHKIKDSLHVEAESAVPHGRPFFTGAASPPPF